MPLTILKNRILFLGLVVCFSAFVLVQLNAQASASQYSSKVSKWLSELETKKNLEGSTTDSEGLGSGANTSSASSSVEGNLNKISIDFYKVDLHNVFRLLGEVSGKNIVVDEDVKGTLTLALKDVPWQFVLDVIKNLKNLSSIERHNTIMIYPASKTVAWAGEAKKPKGFLNIAKKPKLKNKKTLTVKRKSYQATPVHQIIEAKKYLDKALLAEKSGNYIEALKYYKMASDLWPDNTTVAKKIANLALGPLSDPITALNYAKRALKYSPKDGDAALYVAIAYARLGKASEAKAFFERAMTNAPNNYEVLYNYAVFCFSQKFDRKALRLIRRIESQFPVPPDVMAIKAQILERLNYIKEAINEYKAIINSGANVPRDLKLFASARLKALQVSGY